jgi:hypothetical protein
MTDIATPPEVSIEQQRDEAAIDAKLADAAQRTRDRAAAKAAAGQPSTVREIIDARFTQIAEAMKGAEAQPSVRIEADDVPVFERRTNTALREAMIPRRFYREDFIATLDNFQPQTSGQSAAQMATATWLQHARAGEPAMLALVGPQGTGKSHLLYAAANALLDADVGLYARPWYILADELRYGGHHPISNWPIEADEVRRMLLRPSWKSRVWLLDEVRATSGTAFDDMELTKLACFAYDQCHPMMITTNVNPLADVMGAPAASRFRQVVIDGADARQA